jgi:hypothetical protein
MVSWPGIVFGMVASRLDYFRSRKVVVIKDKFCTNYVRHYPHYIWQIFGCEVAEFVVLFIVYRYAQ